MNNHHCQGHPVNFVLVLGLVLPERAVSLEQLVEHASKGEPVGTRVVGSSLGEYFRRHVAVCAPMAERKFE
jgi:hypothetical protein